MASRWRFEIQPIEKWDTGRLIYCLACRCGRQAKWLVIRRWLKFAGYRVLPMWGVQRFLVCQQCGEKYDIDVLRFHPGRKVPPLDRLMLRVMIYAALADGLVDSTEQQAIAALYTEQFDMVLLEDQLRQEIEAAQGEASSLVAYLEPNADLMTLEQKRQVVELAYRIMTAGGTPKPGQQRQLHNLGISLQIPLEEVDAVVAETKSKLPKSSGS